MKNNYMFFMEAMRLPVGTTVQSVNPDESQLEGYLYIIGQQTLLDPDTMDSPTEMASWELSEKCWRFVKSL